MRPPSGGACPRVLAEGAASPLVLQWAGYGVLRGAWVLPKACAQNLQAWEGALRACRHRSRVPDRRGRGPGRGARVNV